MILTSIACHDKVPCIAGLFCLCPNFVNYEQANEVYYTGLFTFYGLLVVTGLKNVMINIRPPVSADEISAETGNLPSPAIVYNVKGKDLFNTNCSSCHIINKTLLGPALAGISSRVPDKQQLYKWIRNSQSVLATGDTYFNDLYTRYNKVAMTSFPQLTDEDIEAILEYIEQMSV